MPFVLKLQSLRVDDTFVVRYDSIRPPYGQPALLPAKVRFYIVLDGYPVRKLEWEQPQDITKQFSDSENRTDEGDVLSFWSTADLIVYEADTRGSNVGWEEHPDAWIQTVRLNQASSSGDAQVVVIGDDSDVADADKTPNYLVQGRTDTKYVLVYDVRRTGLGADDALFADVEATNHASELVGNSSVRGNLRDDKGNCRWICSIDGGGLRGIFPLRMLEQMEDYYGKPCSDMFDMFAGTSTGAIVASMLATGHSLKDVISLYTTETYRERLFSKNDKGQEYAFRYFDFRAVGGETQGTLDGAIYPNKVADIIESFQGEIARLIRNVAKQFITPRYRKKGMKELMYQFLSARFDRALRPYRLRDCRCGRTPKDIFVTAVDLQQCQTTCFSAFHMPYVQVGVPPNDPADPSTLRRPRPPGPGADAVRWRTEDVVTGRYQEALLKDVVEASASAPVYFSARSRFSDGGIGPYNNPSFRAAIEALRFSNVDTSGQGRLLEAKYTPYRESGGIKSGTVLWSFGNTYPAGNRVANVSVQNTIGGSLSLAKRTDTVLFWAETVLESLMYGANVEQDFLCRELLKDDIKYLRFSLGLNQQTLTALDLDATELDRYIKSIKLDAVGAAEFDSMDEVAKKFARYARDVRFNFDDDKPGYRLPPDEPTVDLQSYADEVIRDFADYQ